MPVVVISSDVVFGPLQLSRPDAVPIVTIIEFDCPRCQLTYGVAPCTAAVGVTGDRKCFNTRATCQDLANFDPALFTYRFTRPSQQIHRDDLGDVLPSVRVVRTTPQLLDPGRSIGQRESVSVQFDDHPHTDAGIDPYLTERDYNPVERGTFWGKFRARYPSLRGMPLRVYRGELGAELSGMDVSHYVIESASLSTGVYTITGKDHLKLLDGDRAQAPRVSLGELLDPITAGDSSLTLTPTGIGDIDYPAGGRAAIGGKEIVDFTRVADVVTLTARGLSGTVAVDHDEGDRFQIVLQFTSQPVEAIVRDLLEDYTEVDPAWIPFDDWEAEIGAVVSQLYTTEIAEPTDVRKLVNELIEQVGLIMWWDRSAMLIRLTALRAVSDLETVVGADTIMRDTFRSQDQPNKRMSEVWTYFNVRNPLDRLDDPSNFASIAVAVDSTGDPEEPPAIYKVFSRWIGFGNRAAAVRVNGLLLSRYARPPRRFNYWLYRGSPMPELGRGSRIEHWTIQDDTGAQTNAPVQVIAAEQDFDHTKFEFEEMLFTPNDSLTDVHLIVVDTDAFNVNLRALHDSFYGEPAEYDEVLLIIESGVVLGSSTAGTPSLEIGDWPPLVTITVRINSGGTIQGAGGYGGDGQWGGSQPATSGEQGGTALRTTYPIELESSGSIIGGGGGGGGSGRADPDQFGDPGGGGAGTIGGPVLGINIGASPAQPGTATAGGVGNTSSPGFPGGNGGDPGQAGQNGGASQPYDGLGGGAGPAIDGDSFVTYTTPGTIIGPQIN